jgi:DNA-binding transcriptional ArsR family regulator
MDTHEAVDALAALAQDTRLAAFRLLVAAGGDGHPAGEIARRLDVPHNTLSTHLAALHRAGLVQARRESRQVIYAADTAGIRALLDFLLRDCCGGRPELCAPLPARRIPA